MSTLRDTQNTQVLCLDPAGPGAQRLMQALSQGGFEATHAQDLETAQRLLAQCVPGHFDLAIGEATTGAQQLLGSPNCPALILLDSFGTQSDASQALANGVAEVLARPLPPELLVEACTKALESSQLTSENARLRETVAFGNWASRDKRMRDVLDLAERVADSRASLIIQGESGTGKTRLARAVHQASSRNSEPFIEVNCGALPADLLMSELFGHIRGAFTGADRDRIGKFEAAHQGTIFLDEIASASLDMQVKLLRVLESGCFERVGCNQVRKVDVRVLAACNLDLTQAIESGHFRADLFWRLNVVAIDLPPLRDRPGDLIELAETFLRKFATEYGRELAPMDPLCQALLLAHEWPGNVRELENAIERAVLFSRGKRLSPDDFGPLLSHFQPRAGIDTKPAGLPGELLAVISSAPGALKAAHAAFESFLIRRALEASFGNRQRTALTLDINRSTLFNKMRKYGLGDFPMHFDSPPTTPPKSTQ